MKTTTLKILLLTAIATLGACGKFEKNPVPDLDQYRQNGQLHMDDAGKPLPTVTHTVVTPSSDHEVVNYVRSVGKDDVRLVIADNKKFGSVMRFTPNKKTTYSLNLVYAANELKGQFDVTPEDGELPNGSNFKFDTASGTGTLSWEPRDDNNAFGTDDILSVTFIVTPTATSSQALKDKFKDVVNTLTVVLVPNRSPALVKKAEDKVKANTSPAPAPTTDKKP